ncbi:hypothetical protein RSOLAG22IIIB_13437 [Rhizoctonia solani]|uniref:SET domain-containing protein n=1 Tax=Rhizoctonia solani TaxID=456999 RepID=A0A0K6FN60_9AGAM|nr:hypothetical protein RSOLAG22IIIB_13437 [Rhizoctonia solani]
MPNQSGPSRPPPRPKPRQSAPARVEHDVIVIEDSSDEDAPRPVRRTPPPKPVETITISSSDSDQPKTSPIRPKRPQPLGAPILFNKARPKPRVTVTRQLSLSQLNHANLPPLPPSERDTPSPPQKSNPNVYRTHGAGPSSDVDSYSSSEMIETRLASQPEHTSVVLDSASSTSEESPVDKASPRKSIPIPSSPTPETEPEPEPLVESIANVSLYDEQLPAQDTTVAQAAEAVENVTLDTAPEVFTCSVGECEASFSTAGKLHQHTSRDHGIRLQHQPQPKPGRKKRKASDEQEHLPAKRRPTTFASSSIQGSPESHTSDRFVKRENTVGFEAFAQKVSDQESLVSDPNDPDHSSSSSSAKPSPPGTPPPTTNTNMRAPQPNLRQPVPDQPSQDLSPSKQRAQVKHQVLIPGDPLVTWRVDLVNSMPDSFRKNGGARAVFEAYMDDAMRLNEPRAPAIKVENYVDSEPCPPWEFVYYNTMLYGANVPKPDMDALEGCDCLGPCDPTNQDCACVRRQERYFAEVGSDIMVESGFAFTDEGMIKYHNGAVFGCNSRCSCELECSNKVLQQGRKHDITIRKTKGKGWGVFAKEFIPAGRFIGIYTGELLTEGMASKRAPVYDEFGRTYMLNIDFQHITAKRDAPAYAVDAFHAGNFTRYFNHSCEPNLQLSAYYCDDVDIQKPLIALFTCDDVKAGTELTFSYTGLDVNDEEDRRKVRKIKKAGKDGAKVCEKCLCGAPRCFEIIFTGEAGLI